jgi:peptidylprolyl isomerase
MSEAKNGDAVKMHYTGRLTDGNIFDSSRERDPLECKLGEGQLIPGFEEAVVGMKVGDSKTVNIPADQAYGQRREDLLLEVPREQFPKDAEITVGQQFQINNQEGNQPMVVQVTNVADKVITLDANHPLAGQDLVFDIELMEIK